jgi:hypothetical protein
MTCSYFFGAEKTKIYQATGLSGPPVEGQMRNEGKSSSLSSIIVGNGSTSFSNRHESAYACSNLPLLVRLHFSLQNNSSKPGLQSQKRAHIPRGVFDIPLGMCGARSPI